MSNNEHFKDIACRRGECAWWWKCQDPDELAEPTLNRIHNKVEAYGKAVEETAQKFKDMKFEKKEEKACNLEEGR